MKILIPSTASAATIFLILSSPGPMAASAWQAWRSLRHKAGCTLRQSLRLWIRWVRHRSWTWTEPYSFEQATWQTWCNSETSAVKAGATNVRDNAILPPTAPGDGAGARFVSTDGLRRWRWGALLCATVDFTSLFRNMSRKEDEFPFSSRRHSEVTVESGVGTSKIIS